MSGRAAAAEPVQPEAAVQRALRIQKIEDGAEVAGGARQQLRLALLAKPPMYHTHTSGDSTAIPFGAPLRAEPLVL